jgi:hypothetical protein
MLEEFPDRSGISPEKTANVRSAGWQNLAASRSRLSFTDIRERTSEALEKLPIFLP